MARMLEDKSKYCSYYKLIEETVWEEIYLRDRNIKKESAEITEKAIAKKEAEIFQKQ